MQKFWMMDPSRAKVSIMGEILMNESPYGVNTSYEAFVEDLKALDGAKEIEVVIDSPGGNLFAGRSIYTALKDTGATIHVRLLSDASSAASLIACAGDTVSALSCTMALIHRCQGICQGDVNDLQAKIQMMEDFDRNAAEIYSRRSGKLSAEEFLELMSESRHLTAKELVEIGLVDSIEDDSDQETLKRDEHMSENLETLTMADDEKKQVCAEDTGSPVPGGPEKDAPAPAPDKEDEPSIEDVVKTLTKRVAELEAKIAEMEGDKARIKEIDENAEMFSNPKLLFEAKYNSKQTWKDLAVLELKQRVEQERAYGKLREDELTNSGVNDVAADAVIEPAMNEEESLSKGAEIVLLNSIKEINSKRGK